VKTVGSIDGRRPRRAEARRANPLAALPVYVEPQGPARAQANAWRAVRPEDAALIRMIAEQPQGLWLGDWHYDVRRRAARAIAEGRAAGAVPLLVAYNAPNRDCGQHSSGGAKDAAAYGRWIDRLASGIGADPAIVILEPDGLAGLGCLSRAARRERVALLADAVERLGRLPATAVYLDAGNPGWIPAGRMARRLRAAGVGGARGFAVNVSGFETTARASAYGRAISRRTGGAHFVIDTSRNGLGPAPGEWCNPPGRGLGALPTTDTGDPRVDAFLWVKRPGESDGACNGGPPAGAWWPEYALGLAQRAAAP
jgi:endoglucanase